MPISVPNDGIREHAERLVDGSVGRQALAMAFSESAASSAEVLVEGRAFYPRDARGHRRGHVVRPRQPVRLPARARSASAFADGAGRQGRQGVPVRLVVDRQGSGPGAGLPAVLRAADGGGVEVCVVRATRPRAPAGPLGRGGATRWNLGGLGHIDHRKVARRRRPHRLGRRRRDRGPLQRRALPRPVPPRHGARRLSAPARLPRELPLARRRAAGRELDALFPRSTTADEIGPGDRAAQRARQRTGRSPTRSRACSTSAPRRSTSSIPTSPTAG